MPYITFLSIASELAVLIWMFHSIKVFPAACSLYIIVRENSTVAITERDENDKSPYILLTLIIIRKIGSACSFDCYF